VWKNINQLPDYKDSFPKWEQQGLPNKFYVDSDAVELFQMMTKYDPDQRVAAKDALQHTYFDDVVLIPVNLPLAVGQQPSNTSQFMNV
jgi:hypothetical protein